MATVEKLIKRAFRILGFSAHGQTVDAEPYQDALEALNDFINELPLRHHKDASPALTLNGQVLTLGGQALTLGTKLELQDRFQRALSNVLADELLVEYGSAMSDQLRYREIKTRGRDGRDTLRAALIPDETMCVDTALQRLPSQQRYRTGWW